MRLSAANFYTTLAIALLLAIVICVQIVNSQRSIADNRQAAAQLSALGNSCLHLSSTALALQEARRQHNPDKESQLSQQLTELADDVEQLIAQSPSTETTDASQLVRQALLIAQDIRTGRESLSNLSRLDTLVREQLPLTLQQRE